MLDVFSMCLLMEEAVDDEHGPAFACDLMHMKLLGEAAEHVKLLGGAEAAKQVAEAAKQVVDDEGPTTGETEGDVSALQGTGGADVDKVVRKKRQKADGKKELGELG